MTKTLRLFAALLSLAIALPAGAEQEPRMYAQAELDQMLAPIALYPDPLLSQVLMAATYPLEVAEAARWSRANPGLRGDEAVRAVENEDWDPSVKSLVAFPQILTRMDENRPWTQALGDAFLGQEPQVMDTVQQLRRRAQAAGNLQSNEQLVVQQQGQTIVLLPPRPEYIYVPYYDPLVVYGPWWWPAYRPVYWAPWPGYARAYRPGVTVGFWWGAPVGVSARFFFGNFDWRQRQVRVVNVNNYYYRPPQVVTRTVVVERDRWQHDPSHRRGVAYRVPELRQRYAEFQPRNSTEIRRDEQRRPEERHQVLSRQPQPEQRQVQPQVQQPQPRQAEQRQERQAERRHQQERRSAPEARQQAPQAAPQAQQRPQQQERRQAQQESRQRMPEAVAPQHPRAEQRQERQERQERRESQRERGNKGDKDRS